MPISRDSAALADAILRISASLDLDTVLREAVDAARELTGARLGIVATVDEAGAQDGFFQSGFTAEEAAEVAAWADRGPLFAHLRELSATLRVDDLAAYVGDLGLTPTPSLSRAFQGTPMHYRGVNVGSFFLAEKADGGAFTETDEAVLVLFASQAAAAIANARTHRAERRARADLAALVETSPVGVVVFDGAGRPVSFNREARRIVEALRMPGHPPEQLLEVVACRRADGRETSLADFPLAEQFATTPETVRAEEMVLSVPDGRSMRALVNATPIPAAGGAARSVVVTLQDLAPLDEIERLRTEFLGLVSHELRTPLAAIRGSATTVVDEADDLEREEMREFSRVIVEQADHMRGLVGDLLDAGRIESGTLSVAPEPTAVADLVERARNAFVAGGGRHPVVVDLPDGLPAAMADRRRIAQVLGNLFANAALHAPDASAIRVAAAREAAHVAISVADDGPGVPPERLPHLFQKHIGGSGTAGHGLGLAICRGLVEAHGGRIRADSRGLGHGTTITFTVPAAPGPGAVTVAAQQPPPAAGEPPRILVVDDDPRTLRFVRDALSKAGYAPLVTGSAEELSAIVRAERPRLVLLDLLLPGRDGIELLEQVPELADTPVIFISAYGRDETVARAFEAGAADYVVKPFSPTELVARVRAVLRRHEEPEPFRLGALAIRYDTREVTVGGRGVDLTATEFELLRVLSMNAGRVVPFDTLIASLWPAGKKSADANRVRIFVKQVRDKLGDRAADPAWIFNRRGVGYSMARPGE